MSSSAGSLPVFTIKFLPNGITDKLHTQLNINYGVPIPDPTVLFVDSAAVDELLPETELLAALRNAISADVIKPLAIETLNVTDIAPLINSAAMFVEVKKVKHRLSKTTLASAIAAATAKPDGGLVEIMIGTSHIYIDETSGPVSYLNWTKFSTIATAPSAAPNVLTAADIAAAVASAIPKPPTATELATAFAAAYQPSPVPPGRTTAASRSIPTTSVSSPSPQFNANILAPDVRTRYENKLAKKLILGSTVKTPFASGYFYARVGEDVYVLADGTAFIYQAEPNEKALMRAVVSCNDDSHAGTRKWYEVLTQAFHDYGFYCHPINCFLADHGGERGFTVGDSANDDLPANLIMWINRIAGTIHRLLLKPNMFPPNS